jgi:hypothetical protein
LPEEFARQRLYQRNRLRVGVRLGAEVMDPQSMAAIDIGELLRTGEDEQGDVLPLGLGLDHLMELTAFGAREMEIDDDHARSRRSGEWSLLIQVQERVRG